MTSKKEDKNGKHWEDLVGYTLKDLQLHLEQQFDEYMTWENQGSYWHIDHIVALLDQLPIGVLAGVVNYEGNCKKDRRRQHRARR